jgi:hypothetical protein
VAARIRLEREVVAQREVVARSAADLCNATRRASGHERIGPVLAMALSSSA